jgi:hypothetical protein
MFPKFYPILFNGWAFFLQQNNATSCTSELTVYKNGEMLCWDRGYNEQGTQVGSHDIRFQVSFWVMNCSTFRYIKEKPRR